MITMEDTRTESRADRRRRANETIVRFVGVLAVSVLAGAAALYAWSFFRCFSEERLLPDIPRTHAVRVFFYGSGRGTVSARFCLYDTAGREFSVLDRSWSAQSLSFDFVSASFSGRTFLFPYRIRPSEASRGGTLLSHYYLERGQCMLLGDPCTDRQRLALYRLAVFALSQTTKFATQFAGVQTLNLAQCEMGKVYDIVVDSSGFLQLEAM